MERYCDWRHFTVIYLTVLIIVLINNCSFFNDYRGYELQKEAEVEALYLEHSPKINQYLEEVRQIQARLEKEGFTTYDQFLKERERLIQLRDVSAFIEKNDRVKNQDSESKLLYEETKNAVELAVSQFYTERNKDHEYQRTFYAKSEKEVEEETKRILTKWSSAGNCGLMASVYPNPKNIIATMVKLPLKSFFWLIFCFYLGMIPYGFIFQVRKIKLCHYKVAEQLYDQGIIIFVFSLFWPFMSCYDPQMVQRKIQVAWLERVRMNNYISFEAYWEFHGRVWNNEFSSLSELRKAFPGLVSELDQELFSCLQRVLVTCSILWVLLPLPRSAWAMEKAQLNAPVVQQSQVKKDGTAVVGSSTETGQNPAEEKVVTDSSLTLRYVSEICGVEFGPVDGQTLNVSCKNSFIKFFGRASIDEHNCEGTREFDLTLAELRFDLAYGDRWRGRIYYRPTEAKGIKEVWTEYNNTCSLGKYSIRTGRQFLPCIDGVYPPFDGMLEGSPVFSQFDFHGDGLTLTFSPAEEVTFLTRVFKPIAENKIPADWIFGTTLNCSPSLKVDFMAQIGPDPDEDWLLAGGLSGSSKGSWSYEVVSVIREWPDGLLTYGVHTGFGCNISESWSVLAQFDWTNTETRTGHDRISRHYRVGGGLRFEPVDFLRIQAELAGDWQNGKECQSSLEGLAGVVFRLN